MSKKAYRRDKWYLIGSVLAAALLWWTLLYVLPRSTLPQFLVQTQNGTPASPLASTLSTGLSDLRGNLNVVSVAGCRIEVESTFSGACSRGEVVGGITALLEMSEFGGVRKSDRKDKGRKVGAYVTFLFRDTQRDALVGVNQELYGRDAPSRFKRFTPDYIEQREAAGVKSFWFEHLCDGTIRQTYREPDGVRFEIEERTQVGPLLYELMESCTP